MALTGQQSGRGDNASHLMEISKRRVVSKWHLSIDTEMREFILASEHIELKLAGWSLRQERHEKRHQPRH